MQENLYIWKELNTLDTLFELVAPCPNSVSSDLITKAQLLVFSLGCVKQKNKKNNAPFTTKFRELELCLYGKIITHTAG